MLSSAEMVSNAIQLIKYRWHVPILQALDGRPQRYTGMLLSVTSRGKEISSTALDNALAYLQTAGVVTKDDSRLPVYQLTQAGRELLDALEPLGSWAERHRHYQRLDMLAGLRLATNRPSRRRATTTIPIGDRREPPGTPLDLLQ